MCSNYFKLFNCNSSVPLAFHRNFHVAINRQHLLVAVASDIELLWTRSMSAVGMGRKCPYTLLNVPRDASQADIKSAYYKLCMLHHPDKNNGNAEAAKQFRDISNAYKILGDVDKRKTYDQNNPLGRQSTIYNNSWDAGGFRPDDDAQTRFYKQHMRRASRPTMNGRSSIYNYDEWTSNHYSDLFRKQQASKRSRNYDNVFQYSSASRTVVGRGDKTPVIIVALVIILTLIFCCRSDENDTNKIRRPPKND